jgi:hypothetical protein
MANIWRAAETPKNDYSRKAAPDAVLNYKILAPPNRFDSPFRVNL